MEVAALFRRSLIPAVLFISCSPACAAAAEFDPPVIRRPGLGVFMAERSTAAGKFPGADLGLSDPVVNAGVSAIDSTDGATASRVPQRDDGLASGLRREPNSARRAFWLIEVGVGRRLSRSLEPRTNNRPRETGLLVTGDWGGMVNVSRRAGWGATLYARVDHDGMRAGFKARHRRWLSEKTSLDLGVGPIILGNSDYDPLTLPSFAASANVMHSDLVGVSVSLERLNFENEPLENAVYVGGTLGSELGLYLSKGAIVVAAIACLLFVSGS